MTQTLPNIEFNNIDFEKNTLGGYSLIIKRDNITDEILLTPKEAKALAGKMLMIIDTKRKK